MPTLADKPRRVRRSLLVLLATVVLLAVHMVADFVEGRRLASAVARVPDVFKIDLPQPVLPPGEDALPYYRAAAILASADAERIALVGRRLETAVTTGAGLDGDLRVRAQTVLSRFDIWTLVSEGQGRRLRPLSTSTWGGFLSLDAFLGARTLYASLNGDAPTAVHSSLSEFDLLDRDAAAFWGANDPKPATRVGVLLSHAWPSLEDLHLLSDKLAIVDRDDRLTTQIAIRLRDQLDFGLTRLGGEYDVVGKVGMFGATWASLGVRAQRPYLAAQLASQLDRYAAVLDALRQPWPNRIDAVPPAVRRVNSEDASVGVTYSTASLAMVRAARVAVAIERYRRAHGDQRPPDLGALVPEFLPAIPIDPFSGQPMRYATGPTGYTVYSVGVNRKDDGGPKTGLEAFERGVSATPEERWPYRALDLGIRVNISTVTTPIREP